MTMNNSDIMRLVRNEVARQLNVILSGASGGGKTVETETIDKLYPGMPSIPERPVMHPYGFASRAPSGTIQVTAKQGADPTNRIVLGHRDSKRPTDLETGEAALYSSGGWSVRALNDGIVITNEDGSQTYEFKDGEAALKSGDVSITVDDAGMHVDLGATGTMDFTNGTGEFVAALISFLQTANAGGYPIVGDLSTLLTFQAP